jgi:3-deoxy-manno-octulosonate cytidylyltransferase (CMP-KDO synthetase)
MKILGIIPARYESTRFPGKPLAEIDGKSMIQRVYEQCKKTNLLTEVVVATDDERILNHVVDFGGKAIMTSTEHQSGTERCGEVLEKMEDNEQFFDVIVNIQGDEPFINPAQIDRVCSVFNTDELAEVSTLVKKIENEDELFNENVVKVVLVDEEEDSESRDALYFSRQPIPYQRGVDKKEWLNNHNYFKHIGIYAFKVEEFYEILELEESVLEKAEKLEQLRWVANHFTIQTLETDEDSRGIDTPEDLLRIVK